MAISVPEPEPGPEKPSSSHPGIINGFREELFGKGLSSPGSSLAGLPDFQASTAERRRRVLLFCEVKAVVVSDAHFRLIA
jgi:hypothetical protein